ncbi:unnamed protein product [Brachionus calyciflorus]|uniref:Uncharacterized protein n=1 Tax=Brachionus calyciflorus TaxID=104777 RepID=A0A813M221_9BILA|nr:unnamed protein product [Brachionus calyciflorus]
MTKQINQLDLPTDLYVDSSTHNELNLIDNLTLNDVKKYLQINDTEKLRSEFDKVKVTKSNIKKKNSRKKRYKFTHLSRTQRLRLQARRLNRIQGNKLNINVSQEEKNTQEEVRDNEHDVSEDEENDESLNDSLTTNQYLIQGKKIELTRSDYDRFIAHGKWRPGEFFRLKQLETTTKCEFCNFKSKTQIENHCICLHCRTFAHVSLIKHHMFVCKDNNRASNERCKFKRLPNTTLQPLDPEKVYCRFCHFNFIVNTLPSLNRLQKYLVQFVNNRVIYVNSSSKKTMLWKNRLDLASPKSPQKPKALIEFQEKENNPENSILNESMDHIDLNRKGPRVKHVSRNQPLYLQSVDNIQKPYINTYKFYNELKLINEDFNPVFITWQSFTSDLKTDFNLSALPEKLKINLYKTYDFKFTQEPRKKTEELIPIESNVKNDKINEKIDENQSKPFRAKIRKSCPRVEKLESVDNTAIRSTFDWDDYFERNHRISSNQNFRFSCLNQNGKESYIPKNMSLVKNQIISSQIDSDMSSVTSKRFTCKLNSYKDRFQQLNLDSLNDRLKESINQLNNDLVSNDKNNNSNLNTNKNILINTSDFFQTVSTTTLTTQATPQATVNGTSNCNSNTNNNTNNSNTSIIPFPFVIPDYLVWDNNVINKFQDIPKTGFSVISYYPYSVKSLCYLCGSSPESDNQYYYCSVCCEPYHEHCLKNDQKPKPDSNLIDWLCPSCKYCEICHLVTEEMLYCHECNDSYHFDCLKKSFYPRKPTKKRKIWLCFKCFECKICQSKNVFYEKKLYNRMNNYDYNSCFKCYEKYQLDKPFKCCNLLFNDTIQDMNKIDIEKFLFECPKCLQYFHYICYGLSNIEIDLLGLNQIKLECKNCDSEQVDLREKIESIKINLFQDLFDLSARGLISEYDLRISSFLEKYVNSPQVNLVNLICEFYDFLQEGLESQEIKLSLRLKVSKVLNENYRTLLDYFPKCDLTEKITELVEAVIEPVESIELNEEVKEEPMETQTITTEATTQEITETPVETEPKVKTEEDLKNEQKLLEETRKNFSYFSCLVKAPHEDHTYSIASNSIALALQASDIFNENLTVEKLNSFLDKIKECQMNPTLQKIFDSLFEPLTSLNNPNPVTIQQPIIISPKQTAKKIEKDRKSVDKSEKKEKIEKTEPPKIDFNNLESIRMFSNVKSDIVDSRECLACRLIGDDDICGRLVPFDCYWIHMNCLLWSDDVIIDDTVIEQILNVFHKTKTICCYCKRDGATISCYNKSCSLSYHFNCAYESKCYISDDLSKAINEKKHMAQGYYMLCPEHALEQSLVMEKKFLNESKFKNSIFIDVHDDNYRRKYSFPKFSLKTTKQIPYILIGSLQIENLGDLETLSDYKDFLCPVDYECKRLFWSTNELGKKVVYKCRIRLLNDYKKDLENQNKNSENHDISTKSLDTSDIKFYLDNLIDEKEESLTTKLNEDINLLSQVDGLNDLNVVNTNKNVIKFSNTNGGVTLIRPPPTTIRLPGLSTPGFNPNPSLNPDNKPKILKLESTNLKFSNVRTTFVRVPNPPTFTSEIFMNKNLMLNLNQNKNENLVSPRSDRSDSSLNLNHSSAILNPLQSSFDDLAHESAVLNNYGSLSIDVNHVKKEKYERKEKKEKIPKVKKEKIPKEKKPKKIKTESLSTKCTVAALLSAFNKVEKPIDIGQQSLDISNDQMSNNSNSSQPSMALNESLPSQPLPQAQGCDSLSNFDFFIKKREKKSTQNSNSSIPKIKNKLRDYFKDELDMKLSFTNSLASGSNTNLNFPLIQSPEINLALNNPETKPEKKIRKKDIMEALRLEKKMKKKEAKLLKTKAKMIAMSEKKRLKMAKKLSVQSALLDDQLYQQYAKASSNNTSNRCIVNNYYNDLDLENSSNRLVFEISCEDGLKVISHDLNKAWKVIFDKVRKLRQDYKLKSISFKNMNGARMYGLTTTATIYMLEQLESIQFCPLYKTRYIHTQNINDKWIINLNNCARTMKQYDGNKKCLDPFYWLASEHRSLNFLNLNQRFDQKFFQAARALQSLDTCSSTKYRHLKDFSKSALVVKRSPIHGRGLYTLVDLNQSQMIIEYSGEIIRNELCDRREKFYESKGIGCYMFRIDEFEVIDATTKGNQARFINHSCEPNCISRVLVIGGHKHIVIFAQRAISRGEELTYDYKFPKEDVKIKCLCKSSKCRRYLN